MPFRFLLPALALAAVCGLVLIPASDAEAAGLGVSLICEPDFGGAFCEAVPFGFGYTYGWFTSGNLTLGYGSPSSPMRYVGCWGSGSGGTVSVMVTAPNGSVGFASRWVSCGGSGGL